MALRKFGIFSPVLGLREDIPSILLPKAFTVDNENVMLRDGEIQRCKMRNAELGINGTKIQTPDEKAIIKYHLYEKTTGTDYLLAFTESHAYHWRNDVTRSSLAYDHTGGSIERKLTGSTDDFLGVTVGHTIELTANGGVAAGDYVVEAIDESNHAFVGLTADSGLTDDGTVDGSFYFWDLVFTAGGTVEEWSVVTFYDKCYVTNNTDKIQVWAGTGDFANLGSASGVDVGTGTYLTKARFLASFENYLFAFNVTVGGAAMPQAGYWCDIEDADTWNSGDANRVVLPGPELLRCAGQVDDYLLVFTGRSIDVIWSVPDTLIFNTRRLKDGIGTFSPESLVHDAEGALYFIDQTKKGRRIGSVMGEFDIITGGTGNTSRIGSVDKTFREIQDTLISKIKGFYMEEYQQLCWSIPWGAEATDNNLTVVMDSGGQWTKRAVGITAFGRFENKVTYTIDTIPFATIDEIGWDTIDSVEANENSRFDICADADGYSYSMHMSELDDGDEYDGYGCVVTDFGQAPGMAEFVERHKRLLEVTVIFRNTGDGEANLYIKRDREYGFTDLDTISLEGSEEFIYETVPCDYRAKNFTLKIEASNNFGFVGAIFSYVMEGVR